MIIDVHAHVYSFHDWGVAAEALDRYNIDRVYLSNPDEMGWIYSSTEHVNQQNKIICDFVRKYPKKARYMCYVNPALDTTMDTLKKAFDEDDAKGIKLWVATPCDSPHVNKVAEFAIDHNVPILIHSFYKYQAQFLDESTGEHVANLAERYPEVKLIMAHLGGDAHHGLKYIRNHQNVWVDISASNFRNGDIEYAVKIVGEDRVLFGTDAFGAPYHTNIGKVSGAAISDEIKEKIFWKNTYDLFGEEFK